MVIPFVKSFGFAGEENRAAGLVEEEDDEDDEDTVDNDLDVEDPGDGHLVLVSYHQVEFETHHLQPVF